MANFITRTNRNPFSAKLGESFGLAILFHGVIVVLFTVKLIFFPDMPLSLDSAIRVDVVGLPDKVHDLNPPQPETKPKEVPKPKEDPKDTSVKMPDKIKAPDTINLDKAKLKQNEALDKLKKMNAIDQIKKSLEAESKPKSAPVKGNVISPGTSLTGLNKLQHDEYRGLLNEHVKKNWTTPEWLNQKKLRAQVLVKFDASGILLERKIIHSSGNGEFDALAMSALEKSVPLPAPPEKFVDIVKYNGVVVEFGSEE